ncbi:MAG TPA: HDIG domain-containing protein [Anaerolineae bacterium]|nr:HDIG domain-containing protein [Anaerolineae bacterium]HOQ99732.1 HDIG domain-containing protein [Anaerolineae bacterium]HPL28172.1 HDIG domain-containing protein [Anaerolineae bacterium]
MVTREAAWALLNEYMSNGNLIKHELAVEAAMRAYARRFGDDEDLWGIVGLLHDFDYERYPDMAQHGLVGAQILTERGYPPEVVHAIKAHNPAHGEPRTTLLDRTLFAVDELTGLIVAVALVRPSKSLRDVDVPAVRKKWHDGAFARGVNRADIETGAAELGVDLDEHIGVVLQAMQGIAAELGLAGR